MNHCIYVACAQCGNEYCIRCEHGSCPQCGVQWNDRQALTLESLMKTKTPEEIIEAAMLLDKADKHRLLIKLQDEEVESATVVPKHGKEAFCEFYKAKFGTGYYWTAKDYVMLRQLLNKIKKKLVEQRKDRDENVLLGSFKHYLTAVYRLNDAWYNSNFTMSILNSQFNSLYVKITVQPKQGTVSNEYRQRILNDLQS